MDRLVSVVPSLSSETESTDGGVTSRVIKVVSAEQTKGDLTATACSEEDPHEEERSDGDDDIDDESSYGEPPQPEKSDPKQPEMENPTGILTSSRRESTRRGSYATIALLNRALGKLWQGRNAMEVQTSGWETEAISQEALTVQARQLGQQKGKPPKHACVHHVNFARETMYQRMEEATAGTRRISQVNMWMAMCDLDTLGVPSGSCIWSENCKLLDSFVAQGGDLLDPKQHFVPVYPWARPHARALFEDVSFISRFVVPYLHQNQRRRQAGGGDESGLFVGGFEVPFKKALFGYRKSSGFVGHVVNAVPEKANSDLVNADRLLGAIAVVKRGGCKPIEKARRVMAAGAIALLVINTKDKPQKLKTDEDEEDEEEIQDILIPVLCVGSSTAANLEDGTFIEYQKAADATKRRKKAPALKDLVKKDKIRKDLDTLDLNDMSIPTLDNLDMSRRMFRDVTSRSVCLFFKSCLCSPWYGIVIFLGLPFALVSAIILNFLEPSGSTPIIWASHEGHEDIVALLLHLRALGLVRFDLSKRDSFGETACMRAKSDQLTDKLLTAAAVGPEVALVENSKTLVVNAKSSGWQCSRELMGEAIARGATNPVVAALRMAQIARYTHRERDAQMAATDVLTTAIEACGDNKNALKALLWSCGNNADGGLDIPVIEAMVRLGIREPFTSSSLEHLIDTAFFEVASDGRTPTIVWLRKFTTGGIKFITPWIRHALNDKLPFPSPFVLLGTAVYVFLTPLLYVLSILEYCVAAIHFDSPLSSFDMPANRTLLAHGYELSFLMLYTSVVFNYDYTSFGAFALSAGQLGVFGWSSHRGGDLDKLCLYLLMSSCVYELAELYFKGVRKGLDFGNLADFTTIFCLGLVFYVRISGDGPKYLIDTESSDYAPESIMLSIGLLVGWSRALFNLLAEYEAPAVLLCAVREIVAVDIVRFSAVIVFILFAFGMSATGLYSAVRCDDDGVESSCFIKQKEYAWTYVRKSFVWNLVGIEPSNLNFEDPVDPAERPIPGALLMFAYGFVFMIVMLNLLIAMMSSTFEAVVQQSTVDFKVHKAQRIVAARQSPRLPGQLYSGVFLAVVLGKIVRWCRPYKRDFPLEVGWCRRAAFSWEQKTYEPEGKAQEAAEQALITTRDHLQGGWETTLNSAKAHVKRMMRQRDGIATRESVNYITRANMGDIGRRVGELEEKIDSLKSELHGRRDREEEILAKLDVIAARLEDRGF